MKPYTSIFKENTDTLDAIYEQLRFIFKDTKTESIEKDTTKNTIVITPIGDFPWKVKLNEDGTFTLIQGWRDRNFLPMKWYTKQKNVDETKLLSYLKNRIEK